MSSPNASAIAARYWAAFSRRMATGPPTGPACSSAPDRNAACRTLPPASAMAPVAANATAPASAAAIEGGPAQAGRHTPAASAPAASSNVTYNVRPQVPANSAWRSSHSRPDPSSASYTAG